MLIPSEDRDEFEALLAQLQADPDNARLYASKIYELAFNNNERFWD